MSICRLNPYGHRDVCAWDEWDFWRAVRSKAYGCAVSTDDMSDDSDGVALSTRRAVSDERRRARRRRRCSDTVREGDAGTKDSFLSISNDGIYGVG